MRGLDVARGHAGGGVKRERERKRLGGDDGGLTGRVIGRSTMEKEDKGTMIYSATGCSETSVRRQERDYEATNMCRDEHSVREPGREVG